MLITEAFNLYRSIFLWGLFMNALYLITTYDENDDMFAPNCWAFVVYLSIDITCMGMFKALRRTDLLIHHIVCLFIYTASLGMHSMPYMGNAYMLCESISLMNSILPPRPLLLYRLFTIFAVRYPIWFWSIYWPYETLFR